MRQNTLHRTALAVACALIITALPVTAGAAPQQFKRPNKDGSIPAQWDLPKPAAVSHPDEAPPTAGGNGDGKNTLSFAAFDSGDMVVALGTLTGHAGIWDSKRFLGSIYDKCIWSANTTPVNGVQLERPSKFRGYDYAYGIWVPAKSAYGPSVVSYCAAQSGEPYDINSSKTNYSRWYCSKLPYVGWKSKTGLDLDADGGFWVWPVDLVNDRDTSIFVSAS